MQTRGSNFADVICGCSLGGRQRQSIGAFIIFEKEGHVQPVFAENVTAITAEKRTVQRSCETDFSFNSAFALQIFSQVPIIPRPLLHSRPLVLLLMVFTRAQFSPAELQDFQG